MLNNDVALHTKLFVEVQGVDGHGGVRVLDGDASNPFVVPATKEDKGLTLGQLKRCRELQKQMTFSESLEHFIKQLNMANQGLLDECQFQAILQHPVIKYVLKLDPMFDLLRSEYVTIDLERMDLYGWRIDDIQRQILTLFYLNEIDLDQELPTQSTPTHLKYLFDQQQLIEISEVLKSAITTVSLKDQAEPHSPLCHAINALYWVCDLPAYRSPVVALYIVSHLDELDYIPNGIAALSQLKDKLDAEDPVQSVWLFKLSRILHQAESFIERGHLTDYLAYKLLPDLGVVQADSQLSESDITHNSNTLKQMLLCWAPVSEFKSFLAKPRQFCLKSDAVKASDESGGTIGGQRHINAKLVSHPALSDIIELLAPYFREEQLSELYQAIVLEAATRSEDPSLTEALSEAKLITLKVIKYCNPQGNNVIHLAAERNNVQFIQQLLPSLILESLPTPKNGMREILPKKSEFLALGQLKNRAGLTPALIAAQNGHTEVLKQLVVSNLLKLREFNRPNQPYIDIALTATYFNQPTVIKMLLEEGVSPGELNRPNREGDRILHVAAQLGVSSILPLLHDAGMTGEGLLFRDEKGDTIVDVAIRHHRIDFIECVNQLSYLPKTYKSLYSSCHPVSGLPTPVMAFKEGHLEVLEIIASKNPQLLLSRTRSGKTLTHFIVHHDDDAVALKAMDILLTDKRVTVSQLLQPDQLGGVTFLHEAARVDKPELLKKLMQYGANSIQLNPMPTNKWTPAHEAAKHNSIGYFAVVLQLISDGVLYEKTLDGVLGGKQKQSVREVAYEAGHMDLFNGMGH